jgi:hypothetical protein
MAKVLAKPVLSDAVGFRTCTGLPCVVFPANTSSATDVKPGKLLSSEPLTAKGLTNASEVEARVPDEVKLAGSGEVITGWARPATVTVVLTVCGCVAVLLIVCVAPPTTENAWYETVVVSLAVRDSAPAVKLVACKVQEKVEPEMVAVQLVPKPVVNESAVTLVAAGSEPVTTRFSPPDVNA